MRTPGHDEELAAGFLLSEAIARADDKIEKFSRPASARNRENIIVVDLASEKIIKLNPTQRFGTISSSCGLCGKESIDAIRQSFPPIKSTTFRIGIDALLSLPEKLRAGQSDFARTGGIHADGVCPRNESDAHRFLAAALLQYLRARRAHNFRLALHCFAQNPIDSSRRIFRRRDADDNAFAHRRVAAVRAVVD